MPSPRFVCTVTYQQHGNGNTTITNITTITTITNTNTNGKNPPWVWERLLATVAVCFTIICQQFQFSSVSVGGN